MQNNFNVGYGYYNGSELSFLPNSPWNFEDLLLIQ